MRSTCVAAINWLAGLPVNWDAWAAIGTIGATVVALFLPRHMAAKEWARQDMLRVGQERKERNREAATHREIASAVDRILAYRDAALAIFNSEPVYLVGVRALKRININAEILCDLLGLLQARPGLSDGALYASLAAQKIADDVVATTGAVVAEWGTQDPQWELRKVLLTRHDELAVMTQMRADGVRSTFELQPSKSAVQVRSKYVPLAKQIVEARRANSGEPLDTLNSSYL